MENPLDSAFTFAVSARASSAASTSVGNSDFLARAAVAVGSTVARAAGAFIADLSLGLSVRVAIAVARRALAVNTADTVRDDLVHLLRGFDRGLRCFWK